LAERAGRPEGIADADLPLLRVGAVAVFGSLGLAAPVLAGGTVGLIAGCALTGFGWLYPELWLRSLAARRIERIERRAPLALDVVAASVSAGVGVDQALAGAATAVDGPLRDELERTQANLALGRLRAEEFRDLGERSGSPTLSRLAAALVASDRLGVPMAASLRAEAARARRDRALAVQERAAKAGPRILLVVVFVLVPASMLPLVAAVALGALKAVSGIDL
jgi:tight adherence protein C